jgi:ADP-heptose:LPS heptosyltransferase
VEVYGDQMVFIGFKNEFKRYRKLFDPNKKVRFYQVKDLYEACQIISGSRLLISNATVFYHLAQGLGKTRVFEATTAYSDVWKCVYLGPEDNMVNENTIKDGINVVNLVDSLLAGC